MARISFSGSLSEHGCYRASSLRAHSFTVKRVANTLFADAGPLPDFLEREAASLQSFVDHRLAVLEAFPGLFALLDLLEAVEVVL